MELRPLGVLQVGVVGLGCNNFGMAIDQDHTTSVVDAAIEAGVTYFDTAESYGKGLSEEFLGKALGSRRASVQVATKWGHNMSLAPGERGGDPALIRRCLEASLRRLGTDYVDHYQLHRPDPSTPQEETLGAQAELQAEGKILEIGCTTFTAEELRDAAQAATARSVAPYASIQNHFSLLTRAPQTDGVLDACAELNVAFVPYFPLESGLLTGKYRAGAELPEGSRLKKWGSRAASFIDEDKLARVVELTTWAEAHGHTLLELAMSWLVTAPSVGTVIAGCTSPEQVRSNTAAALAWTMTPAERAEAATVAAGSH